MRARQAFVKTVNEGLLCLQMETEGWKDGEGSPASDSRARWSLVGPDGSTATG